MAEELLQEITPAKEQEILIRALENLNATSSDWTAADNALWEVLVAWQGRPFATAKGLEYTYSIRGGEMFIDRREKSKSLTKSSILLAFHTGVKWQKQFGCVTGPKKLGTFGASYLYPIFQKLGIITSNPMGF